MRLLWSVAVVCLTYVVADAHLGNTVYPIYEISSSDLPDIHDGSLEDWEAAVPDASLNHGDFQVQATPSDVIDQTDMAFRVFLGWHFSTQRIFGAVERLDNVLLIPETGGPPADLTTFYVDGDHSGGQFAQFDDGAGGIDYTKSYAQAQGLTMYPEVVLGVLYAQPGQAVPDKSARFDVGGSLLVSNVWLGLARTLTASSCVLTRPRGSAMDERRLVADQRYGKSVQLEIMG